MKTKKKLMLFFKLAFQVSPMYFVLLLFHSLLGTAQILLNIILPKFLIDELIHNKDTKMLLLYVSLIVLSNLVFGFLTNLLNCRLTIKNTYVTEKMNEQMAKKIMEVPYSCLENPYYLDLKERAVFAIQSQNVINQIITLTATILKGAVTILSLIALMLTLSPVLLLLLFLSLLLSFVFYSRFSKYESKFSQDLIPVNRKLNYYVGLCFKQEIQKDVRLYNMAPMLSDRVVEYNREISHWFTKFYHRMALFLASTEINTVLQSALCYGYIALRVVSGQFGPSISIGSFTMYVSSAVNFTSTFTETFKSVTELQKLFSYLDPFMEFMNLKEEEKETGKIPFEGKVHSIAFKHVTFGYDGSNDMVLKDVSFSIQEGEKISIVGLNGAGKTTLIKLICRLYHPQQGTIKINGTDIFDYDYRTYMKAISAVFQDYKLFNFSIYENVTCKPYNRSEKKLDSCDAMKVLEEVGLSEKLNSLPDGIFTYFGKNYDENGTEFSGGQSQKVAIARALYKEADLVILDEPTSALDPLAEAEIYQNFNNLTKGKTAIYISHRMSSSVFCDRILVLDGGSVSDFDTHANLMKKTDSLYYKLFDSQAQNYSEGLTAASVS